MEKTKNILKRSAVWITAAAVILVCVLLIPQWGTAGDAPEQTQPVAGQEGKVEGQDLADTNTGSGVSPVDVEDDEAGAADDAGGDVEDDPSALIPSAGVPEIHQKLTWEAINSFPIKRSDMTVDEARQLCIDFLRFSKTALWTPKESISFIKNGRGTADTMTQGIVYGGLPYVGVASGSVYRMMDFMDEDTGVLDISKALTDDASLSSGTISMAQLKYFGNQCSIGAWWGWARVVNSANYLWTADALPINKFIMLGEYPGFDEIKTLSRWNYSDTGSYTNTTIACQTVGEQQMYENYALFEKGDGMVQYTTAGHIVMVASDAVVTRNADGTIDGENSFVTVLDQAQKWMDGANAAGDKFRYKNNVDAKWSFATMFSGSYVPFTYDEFHGGAIEETVCEFSHMGSTITKSQLFSAKVTANYGISDVYAIVTDEAGNEVYRHAVRTPSANKKTMNMEQSGDAVDTWGTLEAGTYNIEIVVQLGTGERPTVYVGTLIV